MYYKLFDEVGEYRDKTTKEAKNLLETEFASTPEGINPDGTPIGWIELENLETAIDYFNLELIEKENLNNVI